MEDWSTCTSIDDHQEQPWLPPGFRFHPTDEELVTYYLAKKIQNVNFTDRAIAEADLNKCEPWELPGKAQMGEKECYFYSLRDRKYPTGMRTNRATNAGYWKATGKDRDVMSSKTGRRVGMKKTLVFYRGRAPKGEKTNWVMHEYRVEGNDMCSSSMLQRAATSAKDEWVVCRIFQKSAGGKKVPLADMRRFPSMSAAPAHHFLQYHHQEAASLPALLESPPATVTVPSTTPLGPFSTGVGASSYNPFVSPSAAATYQLPPFSGTSTATATATSSSHAMLKALVDHYSLPCKPEPYSFDPSPFPSSANINNLRFPDLAHYARLPALATENLLSSYTNLFATPPLPSQQQPHQQHQQQQQISLDGMAASLSQDALSDTCGSADLVPNNPPQLPRFPSDLDSLWAYSDH